MLNRKRIRELEKENQELREELYEINHKRLMSEDAQILQDAKLRNGEWSLKKAEDSIESLSQELYEVKNDLEEYKAAVRTIKRIMEDINE